MAVNGYSQTMSSRRKKTIVLKDPKALRALAHPARQQLISELFAGRVVTATEAAELVGLTPSAVSHHLRALEKWGLARRADPTGDGRERPWEGTATALNFEPSAASGSYEALGAVISTQLAAVGRHVDAFIRAGKDPWTNAYRGISTAELWLTEEETRTITATVEGLIETYTKGRSPQRSPRGARKATITWSMVPLEPPPDPD